MKFEKKINILSIELYMHVLCVDDLVHIFKCLNHPQVCYLCCVVQFNFHVHDSMAISCVVLC